MLKSAGNVYETCAEARWRLVLTIAAVMIAVTSLIAMLVVAPNPDGTPRPATTGSEKLLVMAFASAILAAWIAAMAHARLAFRHDRGRRFIVLCLLVVGNFVGALVYLLVYALWRPRSTVA